MYNKPKTESEIAAIRKSGAILAKILSHLCEEIKPGMTGEEIDAMAVEMLKQADANPAFLGYMGYQHAICISVNDAVVHGIPNDQPFKSGDIVGLDFGVEYDGMITDAARTIIIGGTARNSDEESLVAATKKSLDMAIKQVKAGCKVGDIAAAAQAVLDSGSYGIVRDLVGHGVGHHVHEDPEIPNYGEKGSGPTLMEGMTIAIEPMATLGDWRVVLDPDGWTIRTRDGTQAAHFEDTVLVTKQGCVILTR